MWLVVGLGNPGRRYEGTRHNAGFMCVRSIAKKLGVSLRKKRCRAKIAEGLWEGEKIMLVLPQTYMNKSGEAVRLLLNSREVKPERLVVIYDDLDIPLGEIRVRKEGGAGSHKGMLSIIDEIGTTKFPRIRIGTGPLPEGTEATDYVLSFFAPGELVVLENSITKTEKALALIIKNRIEKAMNDFNQRGIIMENQN